MISVVIVEDEKFYNNTLKRLLDIHKEFVCVAQLYTGSDALVQLPLLRPDVVLMDLHLQDHTGSAIIKQLKDQLPETSFVVITSFEDDEKVYESFRAGAVGYLIKGESLENIIKAIHDAFNGGVPMSNAIAQKVVRYFRDQETKPNKTAGLSKTEQQILELMAQGQQYKEIAYSKNISVETVKKHISNIYRKLGVGNKVEAINFLRQNS